jgi:hypothetical protein
MKKTARLGIRLTPLEKTYWEKEAKARGFSSTAAWITYVLNREAGIEVK